MTSDGQKAGGGEGGAFSRFDLQVQKKIWSCSDKFFIDPETGTKI